MSSFRNPYVESRKETSGPSYGYAPLPPQFQIQSSSSYTYAPLSPQFQVQPPQTQYQAPFLPIELSGFQITQAQKESLRKCRLCKKYIRFEDFGSVCRHHSGVYQIPYGLKDKMSSVWTCCQAGDEGARGCSVGTHQEDLSTNALLDKHFPLQTPTSSNSSSIIVPKTPEPAPPPPKTPEPPKEIVPSPEMSNYPEVAGIKVLSHKVDSSDTLIGIAVRYNTKVDLIKRLNNMINDSLAMKDFLYIPASTASIEIQKAIIRDDKNNKGGKHNELIQSFKTMVAKASTSEAQYYLTEADWDLKEAIRIYREDMAWEQENRKK